MNFSGKLRLHRNKKGITQKKLAEIVGVTRGTIANYELGTSYPKNRDIYSRLAEYFGVSINYFLTEGVDEIFLATATEQFSKKGTDRTKSLMDEAAALFAGEELSQKDKIAFLQKMQTAFLGSIASLASSKPMMPS
jgi:transcriptional regulator with XRE-family HTH domain